MASHNSAQGDFVDEALKIVSAATQQGIVLRLMGALVVRLHCQKFLDLHDQMKRELTDLDFVTYRNQGDKLKLFFTELGYTPDEHILTYFGDKRQKYYNVTNGRGVDIFLDKLEMCHTIPFNGRLELDSPTITLADFILEKMQIVQLNEKDVKDTIVIFREHEVGESDKETVNASYIAKILSDDWGFYYTVTSNLSKTKNTLPSVSILDDETRVDVSSKIDNVVKYIEKEPKTLGWKMRARVGPKKKWYRDVEELVR